MADLGIDVNCVYDVDPAFSLVSGRKALSQALARRLITPRGALWLHPDYGFDVRSFLNDTATQLDIVSGVVDEVLKDERVLSAECSVIPDGTSRFKLYVSIVDADGPFNLVLSVDDVTLEILSEN